MELCRKAATLPHDAVIALRIHVPTELYLSLHLQDVGADGIIDDKGRHNEALWMVNAEINHLLEVVGFEPNHVVVHLDVDGILVHAELVESVDGGDAIHTLVGLPNQVDFRVLRCQLLEELDVTVVDGIDPNIIAVEDVTRQHLREEILHIAPPSCSRVAHNFIASIHVKMFFRGKGRKKLGVRS